MVASLFLVEPAESFATELQTDHVRRPEPSTTRILSRSLDPAGRPRSGHHRCRDSERVVTPDATLTHCPYCALNCGIGLGVANDADHRPRAVEGLAAHRRRRVLEGVDGVGAGAPSRPAPERRSSAATACSWRPVGRRRSTSPPTGSCGSATSHGADANAVLSGGSLTNEKAYLMGKFARLALGTRHIDYNGRFCMVSAGSANMMAFGMDRAMTPLDELVDADVIVVVGANLSDAYPVMLPTTINKARQRGARVVAIDPRFGRWVQDDDLQIAIRPGTDGALFAGLLAEIEAQGLIDTDFVRDRTVGFDAAIAAAREWRPERVEAVTDVAAAHGARTRPADRVGPPVHDPPRPRPRAADDGHEQRAGDDQRRARLRPHRQAELRHQHAHRPAQRPGWPGVGSALQPAPRRPIDQRSRAPRASSPSGGASTSTRSPGSAPRTSRSCRWRAAVRSGACCRSRTT